MRRKCTRQALELLGLLGLTASHCATDQPEQEAENSPTYWQDMAPLFADHCVMCHREAGIAPMRLDDVDQAKRFAALIASATSARTMPPWLMTADGSCGDFSGSLALSDAEIARIGAWARAGAPAGQPREIASTEQPSLAEAQALETPQFVPEVQGGALGESDEYRCFAVDSPFDATSFMTAYEVVPGTPEIVHHVMLHVVERDAPAPDGSGHTNAEVMRALDEASPDRAGWPCFSGAGDGVEVKGTPVVWAPGQGIVQLPDESGVALLPTYALVIQVHYNLADPRTHGLSDQTKVRLRVEPQVTNLGFFVLIDPLLDSLESAAPVLLPAAQTSTLFEWNMTGVELNLPPDRTLSIRGVMPHMHQLGHKYRMTFSEHGEEPACAADVQRWDFHWQRMYFYEQPRRLQPESQIHVTCDFDTSARTEPVSPGWSTRDEMCLTTLYLTVPL
jgi:hypothetical protein